MGETVYLVTITDYEDATILGAYSTEDKAHARVDDVRPRLHAFGRNGPFIIPIVLDEDTTMWAEGDTYTE